MSDAWLERVRRPLEAFLTGAAEAGSARIERARSLAGGAIQENWRLEVDFGGGPFGGRQELVLRTDAASGVAASHSRPREFALLKAAWAAGVTVPEPLWLCADEGPLGRPFFIMRRARGVALGHLIVKDPGLGGDRAALAERLGAELARIHGITPPRPDLAFLGDPKPDPAADAVARYRSYLDALGESRPALEWGLRWCELNAVRPKQLVLAHQDFRTGNYLLDEHGLTGILDWEFSGWGDPMSDIGWFCARCWRFGRDDLEAGGIAPREDFYRGYEAASERRVDPVAVAFWEVMAHIRWAVIGLQQGHRHLTGGEASLELALTGRMVAELEREVLTLTAPQRWGAV